jgi:hypothetical protein
VPVRGKVTLDGGPWPREGTVNFTPTATAQAVGGAKSRPGSARFGVDGSFTVGSYEAGDGLFPGTYTVAVDCASAPPQMSSTGQAVEAPNVVPKKYQNPSTSGLTLTVKAGEPVEAAFDVKSKSP